MNIFDQHGNPINGKSKEVTKMEKFKISTPLDFIIALGQLGIIHEAKTADLVNYLDAGVELNKEKYETVKNVKIADLKVEAASRHEVIEKKKLTDYFEKIKDAYLTFMSQQDEIESLDLPDDIKNEMLGDVFGRFNIYKENLSNYYDA